MSAAETLMEAGRMLEEVKQRIADHDADLAAFRERSGSVESTDPLVRFLYLLMRDHLPSGTVEEIADRCDPDCESSQFTNGWLASHAIDLAGRLGGTGLTPQSSSPSPPIVKDPGRGMRHAVNAVEGEVPGE